MLRVELPDPVELVIDFLAARVDEPVSAGVPKTRPSTFVTVERTGGPALNRVVEQPMLSVQAWAASKAAAAALADEIRWAFLNESSALRLVRQVNILSTYFDPDPDSQTPRVTVSVQLTTRAARV